MFNLLPYNEVNEQFSNENGNPGFLLSVSLFKMHQKNVLVHALLRDPLRGGRGDFTEIKFDQIRSRCDKFGDFFAKILRFEGFPRFSLSCRRR